MAASGELGLQSKWLPFKAMPCKIHKVVQVPPAVPVKAMPRPAVAKPKVPPPVKAMPKVPPVVPVNAMPKGAAPPVVPVKAMPGGATSTWNENMKRYHELLGFLDEAEISADKRRKFGL